MQPPHPQREGQVTKLPAIFGFLPSMENIIKNPAPTDEIMPALNHSSIYNTQNSQKTLCARIYILNGRVVQECQITN